MSSVSFVVTSRNDGDTNEELRRMQIFVSALLEQCDRFMLDSELIIIEWNPPVGRPSLSEILGLYKQSRFLKIRVIVVPAELHNRFENAGIIPLFQMIAKNVGICRANKEFVLATNIDILFNNQLINYLATNELNHHRMYRINRYDVPSTIPDFSQFDERLDWCRKNFTRVYRYLATTRAVNGKVPLPVLRRSSFWHTAKSAFTSYEKPLHTNACGDFTLLAKKYWEKVGGNPELPVRAMKLDSLLCYAAHYTGAKECILKDPMRIYHIEHPARGDGADIALEGRNSQSDKLQISKKQYKTWIKQMRNTRQPIFFNKIGWGLRGEKLSEISLN